MSLNARSGHDAPGSPSGSLERGQATLPAFLTDFGLAKLAATGSKLTKTGQALGTAAYMSPEQARGEVSSLTTATDLWSIGCVLYEMLGGRPPFEGETDAAVVGGVLLMEPPRLRTLRGELPGGLDHVVRVCLGKRARDRYRAAVALRDDLDRVLRGRRPSARLQGVRRRAAAIAVIPVVTALAAAAAWPSASPPPAPPRRSESSRYESLLVRAREQRRSDPAEAATLLRAALEAGAAEEARLERADCLREGGLYHEAEAEYGRVLERESGRVEAHFGRGLARWIGRQAQVAGLRDPSDDLAAAAERLTGWRGAAARAILAYRRRDWDAGERELGSCEGVPEARLVAGLLRHHEGRGGDEEQRRAVADFTAATEWVPRLAIAWLERGHARYLLGDHARALGDFDRALELDSRLAVAWVNRGNARTMQGDVAGALADYDRALELDPRCALGWSSRANAKRALGDLAGAIADCDRALALDPQLVDGWNNRGNARYALGDHARALADFERSVELDPDLAVAWGNRGAARRAQGDLAGALADFDRALELDPRNVLAWYNRGNSKRDSADLAGAVADYDRALELDPRYAAAWNNRGDAKRALGDLAGALADFEKALEVAPPGWPGRAQVVNNIAAAWAALPAARK
ncbi:MAG: tetratricopeptide repeat protein [Planctomycetales bacterium]|nr:tetratricopeptide repeat protein [Planctomycetales bacterium]